MILCASFHFLFVSCYRNDIVWHRDKPWPETRAVSLQGSMGRLGLVTGECHIPSTEWLIRNLPEQSPASASRWCEDLNIAGMGKISDAWGWCDRRRNDRVMFKLLSSLGRQEIFNMRLGKMLSDISRVSCFCLQDEFVLGQSHTNSPVILSQHGCDDFCLPLWEIGSEKEY